MSYELKLFLGPGGAGEGVGRGFGAHLELCVIGGQYPAFGKWLVDPDFEGLPNL